VPRSRPTLYALTAFALAALALPARVGAQAPQDAFVTSVIIGEGVELSDEVTVALGIRRGTRGIDGVRYRHLGDALGAGDLPAGLFETVEGMDAIADAIRNGDYAGGGERAQMAIDLLEESLVFVRRANLIDAHMLRAISYCGQRRRRAQCVEAFEHVLTFREGLVYDLVRYPGDFAPIFDEVRDRLLAEGMRGSIEVQTDPPGAEVFVDGRSIGPSPAVAEGLLVGDHYVTVKAPGYEEIVRRATVEEAFQATVEYTLYEHERAQLVTEKLPRVREELGQQRAGESTRALGTVLNVSQTIIAVVTPAAGDELNAAFYLYHNRTLFLLSQREAVIARGPSGAEQVQQLVVELYEGVDRGGQIEAPDDGPALDESPAIYEQWWFWTAVGVVLVSGSIAAYSIFSADEVTVPEGWWRFDGQVQ